MDFHFDWLNSSGGALYHYMGLRFRKNLWASTTKSLTTIMHEADFKEDKIVLLGPSALYLLEDSLFRGKNVVGVDIDPTAPLFFKMNHRIKIDWQKKSLFQLSDRSNILAGLKEVIKIHSPARFIFCNLLGQLNHLYGNETASTLLKEIPDVMRATKWCSFHERFTVETGKKHQFRESFQTRPSDHRLIESWSDTLTKKPREILDHQTRFEFQDSKKYVYLSWPFNKNETHLIEVAWN